jgi:hypothetical protein
MLTTARVSTKSRVKFGPVWMSCCMPCICDDTAAYSLWQHPGRAHVSGTMAAQQLQHQPWMSKRLLSHLLLLLLLSYSHCCWLSACHCKRHTNHPSSGGSCQQCDNCSMPAGSTCSGGDITTTAGIPAACSVPGLTSVAGSDSTDDCNSK